VARTAIAQRIAFRFAGTWAPSHGAATDAAALAAYRAAVVAAGVPVTDATWAESAPALTADLGRELARRTGGAAAAMRVSLATDPDWQRAASVLRRARTAGEVFALAGVQAGAAPAKPAAAAKPAAPAKPTVHRTH
jgi:hypothetical protein